MTTSGLNFRIFARKIFNPPPLPLLPCSTVSYLQDMLCRQETFLIVSSLDILLNKQTIFNLTYLLLFKTNTHQETLKGSVSIISSDPPCKDGNARFTTVHISVFIDQAFIRYPWL